jgi:SAM-dependent methyltransferase
MEPCKLCGNEDLEVIHPPKDLRNYFLCSRCKLIMGDKKFYLDDNESRRRYSFHQNSIDNHGYVEFLRKAITPALPFLNEKMIGLDYGCGPGPTLSKILQRDNIICHNYDPLFFDQLLKEKYDFIFSTECFEHFYNPLNEIQKVDNLLIDGGILIVMTSLWSDLAFFDNWHYKIDPTHVSFFHLNTFQYMARIFNYQILFTDEERVIVFRKIPTDKNFR